MSAMSRNQITRRAGLAIVAALALGVTACSGGDSAPATDEYAESGPFDVGVTTLTLDRGPDVEVWYPTANSDGATDTYDVRDFTPEAIRNLLTGDVDATFTIVALRDADVADGSHPVVLFSHGASGIRLQSSFLTSHLASWGVIVIAPDHWSRDLPRALVSATVGTAADTPDDLFDALDLVSADERFADRIDTERIVALGHSAGGGTVLRAAEDDRVDGYVSMASGDLRGGTDTGSDAAAMPAKPSFFLAGTLDAIVTPEERTRPAFDRAPSPSLLWIIDGVGHNGFDDFCTFGDGKGIIGVAEASGLGAFLDAQPGFKRLGEDGCLPPAEPVETAFPIIRHAVTAWILDLFGMEDTADVLGADVADAYELAVEIVVK
jgi:dienelactone hydrolase